MSLGNRREHGVRPVPAICQKADKDRPPHPRELQIGSPSRAAVDKDAMLSCRIGSRGTFSGHGGTVTGAVPDQDRRIVQSRPTWDGSG
jgi:hypothetical protein